MDLRPLRMKDEVCQIELLHAAAAAQTAVTTTTQAAQTATMLPIMVIPTSVMPPGTIFTTTVADGSSNNGDSTTRTISGVDGGLCEHQFYQIQPTHILATASAVASAKQQDTLMNPNERNSISLVEGTNSPTTAAILMPTLTQAKKTNEQQPHIQSQQIPQTFLGAAAAIGAVSCSPTDAMVNIIYAGTLGKSSNISGAGKANTGYTSLLTQKTLEAATLPRGFQPNAYITNATATAAAAAASLNGNNGVSLHDESDFEGSECGASISTTTCIPPFRFSGCGVILQPASSTTMHTHQHQHQYQSDTPPPPGCGALSHMMGSFTTAGSGRHNTIGRFAVGSGLAGTLGRNRRSTPSTATQTPKRVSFRADTMPPSDDLHQQYFDIDTRGLRLVHHSTPPPPPTSLSSCAYMHYDNTMDYQTTGFGGLPDVTEHSNIRRTLSRQNSISNSDSGGEIVSIQKTKTNFSDRIKISTSSCGGDSGNDERLTTSKQHKSKAAQRQGSRETIVKSYKTKRGSLAIGLTLIAALSLLAIATLLAYQYFFMAPSRNSLTQRLRIVQRILRDVPLVDGHNNFAWNVRKYGQSSLELVHEQQNLEHKTILSRPTWAQTDMERLKQGLVGVQVWSAYVPCEAQGLDAVQLALEQIDIIRRLADMFATETSLITSSQDIFVARQLGLMASLIGIEGGHAIGASLGVLRSLYSLGARYLTLTHRCDVPWAGSSSSTQENQGLTQFGKAIIREMNRLGMMIDLSHSSDATARDVLQATRAPVIFSHSAARHLCNSTRNVPDDILRLVAENGGLIMVSFDSEDVACNNGRQARLKDVIDHIKYIRSIAGIQHIGLGAGYDGIETPPMGLEDVSKYPDLLASLLEDQNWSEEDIAMLAGKNFLRIMETVENVRDYWKRAAIQPIEQTEPQPRSQCTYMSS